MDNMSKMCEQTHILVFVLCHNVAVVDLQCSYSKVSQFYSETRFDFVVIAQALSVECLAELECSFSKMLKFK